MQLGLTIWIVVVKSDFNDEMVSTIAISIQFWYNFDLILIVFDIILIKRLKKSIKRSKKSICIENVDFYQKSCSNLITFDQFRLIFDINWLFCSNSCLNSYRIVATIKSSSLYHIEKSRLNDDLNPISN